jgi:hypothetical protein
VSINDGDTWHNIKILETFKQKNLKKKKGGFLGKMGVPFFFFFFFIYFKVQNGGALNCEKYFLFFVISEPFFPMSFPSLPIRPCILSVLAQKRCEMETNSSVKFGLHNHFISFSFSKLLCFLGSHLIFPPKLESPKGEVIQFFSFWVRKIVVQHDWVLFLFFWLQSCPLREP